MSAENKILLALTHSSSSWILLLLLLLPVTYRARLAESREKMKKGQNMVNNKAEQVYRLPIVSSTVFGQLLHSIFLSFSLSLYQHDPDLPKTQASEDRRP